jgi:hypothetical protein
MTSVAGDAPALPGVDRRHQLNQTDHLGDRHGLVLIVNWVCDACAPVPVALSRLRGVAARPVPGRERSGRPVCRAGRRTPTAA